MSHTGDVTQKGIQITVLSFAQVKDKLGAGELLVALPEHATAQALLVFFEKEFPKAFDLIQASRIAVNGVYAAWGDKLSDGDEVAVIPPVSGG